MQPYGSGKGHHVRQQHARRVGSLPLSDSSSPSVDSRCSTPTAAVPPVCAPLDYSNQAVQAAWSKFLQPFAMDVAYMLGRRTEVSPRTIFYFSIYTKSVCLLIAKIGVPC